MAKRFTKYKATPTTVEGRRFHSKGEAARYLELRLLEKAGEISALECQPVFTLNAPLTTGKTSYALKALTGYLPKLGKYIADFKYYDERKGEWVIEDFKGYDVPLGKWKRKHAEQQYGVTVQVITKTRLR